jgi:hypothetical protein
MIKKIFKKKTTRCLSKHATCSSFENGIDNVMFALYDAPGVSCGLRVNIQLVWPRLFNFFYLIIFCHFIIRLFFNKFI